MEITLKELKEVKEVIDEIINGLDAVVDQYEANKPALVDILMPILNKACEISDELFIQTSKQTLTIDLEKFK